MRAPPKLDPLAWVSLIWYLIPSCYGDPAHVAFRVGPSFYHTAWLSTQVNSAWGRLLSSQSRSLPAPVIWKRKSLVPAASKAWATAGHTTQILLWHQAAYKTEHRASIGPIAPRGRE